MTNTDRKKSCRDVSAVCLLANCSRTNRLTTQRGRLAGSELFVTTFCLLAGFNIHLFCCCAVKDRYGDRADESGSELSESSSDDDSEVVGVPSYVSLHVINKITAITCRRFT